MPLVYSRNIFSPENHRVSRTRNNFKGVLAKLIPYIPYLTADPFGTEQETFGVYKTDYENAPYVRPVYTALPLAYRIGVLGKIIPYIPHLTANPARDLYSQRYQDYDAQLPKHVLTTKRYKSLIVSRIAKSS